jgi:outer membrane biosynthesis protein TonB
MLIIALVLALIGLVALVFAVVTSNELVAWVCIGASILGVVLLIVDALRERQRRDTTDEAREEQPAEAETVDYPEETPDESTEQPANDETVAAEARGEDSAK